jgi:hypothetical protein
MLNPTPPLFVVSVLQSINSNVELIRKNNPPVFPIEYDINNPVLFPLTKPFFERINNAAFEVDIETENAISFENRLNSRQLIELEQRFSRQLISYILEDDFEYGMETNAHILVKEQMKINASITKDWLNKIYVDNFKKPEILIGILQVIARFERDEIYPIGDTIAIASLNHKDETVRETAIRAFESWGGFNSIKILETVTVSSQWVKEYLDGVISDLKSEYAGKKNQ